MTLKSTLSLAPPKTIESSELPPFFWDLPEETPEEICHRIATRLIEVTIAELEKSGERLRQRSEEGLETE